MSTLLVFILSFFSSLDPYYISTARATQTYQELEEDKDNINQDVSTQTTVFIFLHGIYEDTTLYSSLSSHVKNLGYEYINFNLPGHGEDAPQSYEMTYQRWIKGVEQIAQVFKNKKIIFVGHSLGALLALNYTLDNPDHVLAMVIIEPSLEPWGYIKNTVCEAKNILKDARLFLPLARLFLGIPAKDRPIAVNMACELVKLAPAILNKNNARDFSDLANQIEVPVLMFNNLSDNAVNPQTNIDFFESLKNKKHSRYEFFKNMPHGAVFLRTPDFIQSKLVDFLSSSLRDASTKPD